MARDLRNSTHLAWRLFLRDLRAQYRQSAFGYLWALGTPVATALLFVFLRSRSVLSIGEVGLPYPVFVFGNLVFWEAFASALASPLAVAAAAVPVLTKLQFPREALVLSGIYQVLFGIGMRLLLLIAVLAWFRVTPAWSALLLPVGLVALVALGFAVGLLLLPLGLLYQDVGRALPLVSAAWMLLTPVVYAPSAVRESGWLGAFNPVSPLVTTTRELLLGGPLTQLYGFTTVGAIALVLLFAAWILVRVAMPHVVARMGA
jgi:lipopolysaccharide transport system permease protein